LLVSTRLIELNEGLVKHNIFGGEVVRKTIIWLYAVAVFLSWALLGVAIRVANEVFHESPLVAITVLAWYALLAGLLITLLTRRPQLK
jgi:uncharacterized membrane protein